MTDASLEAGVPYDNAKAIDDLIAASALLASAADRQGPGSHRGWAQVDEAALRATRAASRLFGPRPGRPASGSAKSRILSYLLDHVGEWVDGDELRLVAAIGEWARRVRELRVEQGWPIEEQGGRYRLTAEEPDPGVADAWRVLHRIRRRDGNARERVRALFEAKVGEIVSRDALDYVARIKEGSRRVRELRDEEGWPIESHIDDPALRPGQYRLVSADEADRRDPRQRLYPEGVRAVVFKRDNYTCQMCGRDREAADRAGDRRFFLEIHHRAAVADHLEMLPRSELNNPENLVTLCHADHVKETAGLQRRRRQERGGS